MKINIQIELQDEQVFPIEEIRLMFMNRNSNLVNNMFKGFYSIAVTSEPKMTLESEQLIGAAPEDVARGQQKSLEA